MTSERANLLDPDHSDENDVRRVVAAEKYQNRSQKL
jgi:hypothetical protein